MNDWPTTLDQAQQVQQALRNQVVTSDDFGTIRTIAGIDAGYEGDQAKAAVVVLAYPSLEPLDYVLTYRPAPFPYIPGFLSFREAPAVLAALSEISIKPDMLMLDGQGIAHPRRFGIAAHVGVLTGLPSIGCAKSLLCGRHGELPDERGASVPLIHRGEQIGAVLRSRVGVKPLFISIGHRIGLASALGIVMACVTKYRLPEITRAADGLASHGRVPQVQRAGS
ncbi:MAG: deoxyribonuclease V [Roseiflexaceae bacterium]|nr:deoxyribonuclease V [Roseiflexaceae bacterium]